MGRINPCKFPVKFLHPSKKAAKYLGHWDLRKNRAEFVVNSLASNGNLLIFGQNLEIFQTKFANPLYLSLLLRW